MKKIIKVTENNLKNIFKKVLFEQEENDNWVKISPEKYLDIMKYASYNAKGVSMLPQFKGKKIWITGNLELSRLPISSLEGVGYVEGNLDISNTSISDISFINVKGNVRDWDSGVSRIKLQRIKQAKLSNAQDRRESDEWSIESGDETGNKARAVLQFIYDGNSRVDIRTDEDNARMVELNSYMESLLQKEKQYDEEGRDLTDIFAEIEATEEEINEINDKMDVYHLVPRSYDFYGLESFEVVGNDDLEGAEYAVGTEEELDDAALEYAKSYIDEVGIEGFSQNFISDYIDSGDVADYFEDWWRDDIYQNPEVYFNDDDFELTREQETRISEIENLISELEDQQNNLDDEIEDPDEYSEKYDEIQEKIDELESEKDDITPDTNSPTDDMVEDKLQDLLYDVKRNPLHYIQEYSLNLKDFIDEDELAKGLVDTDGYGVMNSYDGNYEYVGDYIVMRIS